VRVRVRSRRGGRSTTTTKHVVRYVDKAVASRRVPARAAGAITVSVTLSQTYKSLAKGARGLDASLALSMPFGGRTLKATLPVTFRARPAKKPRKKDAS
jgi:hypothetical protein